MSPRRKNVEKVAIIHYTGKICALHNTEGKLTAKKGRTLSTKEEKNLRDLSVFAVNGSHEFHIARGFF